MVAYMRLPTRKMKMVNARSALECGTMSPYPIVVIVVKAQCTLSVYLSSKGASSTP